MVSVPPGMDPLLATVIPDFESRDPDDPQRAHAWVFNSLPSGNAHPGDVATPVPFRYQMSERLEQLGYRHHPELQVLFPIPGPHPEAGWMNPPEYVDRDAYEKYWAEHAPVGDDAAATEEQATEQIVSLFAAAAPPAVARQVRDAARQAREMTPEQREAALAEQRKQLPHAVDQLARLAEHMNQPPPAAPQQEV